MRGKYVLDETDLYDVEGKQLYGRYRWFMSTGTSMPQPAPFKGGAVELDTSSGAFLIERPITGLVTIPIAIKVTDAGPGSKEDNFFANRQRLMTLFYRGRYCYLRWYPNLAKDYPIVSQPYTSSVRQDYYGSSVAVSSVEWVETGNTKGTLTVLLQVARQFGGESLLRGKWRRTFVEPTDWTWDSENEWWKATPDVPWSINGLPNTDWAVGMSGIDATGLGGSDIVTVEFTGIDGPTNRRMSSLIRLRNPDDSRPSIYGFKIWAEAEYTASRLGSISAIDLSDLLNPNARQTHDSVYSDMIDEFIANKGLDVDDFRRNRFKPDFDTTNVEVRVVGFDPRTADNRMRIMTRYRVI